MLHGFLDHCASFVAEALQVAQIIQWADLAPLLTRFKLITQDIFWKSDRRKVLWLQGGMAAPPPRKERLCPFSRLCRLLITGSDLVLTAASAHMFHTCSPESYPDFRLLVANTGIASYIFERF